MLKVIKDNQKPLQTVKLTFHHRPKPRNVDMQTSVRRNETKPPTYLFRYYQFQRARDNNITIAPHTFKARPPTLISFFNLDCVSSASLSACNCASLCSVRGLLGIPQRQYRASEPPSPLVFLQISTNFTSTLGIPLTSLEL